MNTGHAKQNVIQPAMPCGLTDGRDSPCPNLGRKLFQDVYQVWMTNRQACWLLSRTVTICSIRTKSEWPKQCLFHELQEGQIIYVGFSSYSLTTILITHHCLSLRWLRLTRGAIQQHLEGHMLQILLCVFLAAILHIHDCTKPRILDGLVNWRTLNEVLWLFTTCCVITVPP